MIETNKINHGNLMGFARSNFGSSGSKLVLWFSMPKWVRKKSVMKDIIKKPGGVVARSRNVCTPSLFKDRFLKCATSATALPYPMKGGRRAGMALLCADWVLAAKKDEYKTYKMSTMIPGFLAIHASRREELKEVWDVEDTAAQSWAKQMACRLQNLLRHISQASVDPPGWLEQIWSGTAAANPRASKTEPLPATKTKKEPEDDGEDGGNEEEEEDEEEEYEEEEPEDDGEDPPEWNVLYCFETSMAYRMQKGAKKRPRNSQMISYRLQRCVQRIFYEHGGPMAMSMQSRR